MPLTEELLESIFYDSKKTIMSNPDYTISVLAEILENYSGNMDTAYENKIRSDLYDKVRGLIVDENFSRSKSTYPTRVGYDIFKDSVNNRCKKELSFLQGQGITNSLGFLKNKEELGSDILTKLAKQMNSNNGNPLNIDGRIGNGDDKLCTAIVSLNELSRQSVRDSLHKCNNKLANLKDEREDVQEWVENHPDYNTLQRKLKLLSKRANNWNEISNYYDDPENNRQCDTTTCIANLQETAKDVTKLANNCGDRISDLLKQARKSSINDRTGEKDEANFWEKTKYYAGVNTK